jgi:uncharacterized membrane protein
VVGRQFIRVIDRVLQKIPLAGKIYAGTKQVVSILIITIILVYDGVVYTI